MKCNDTRKCFAKTSEKMCTLLTGKAYADGECPFCKSEREITNGKYYPFDPFYVSGKKK